FFFSSRRRHTRFSRDWSSDVCSSDLGEFACPCPSMPHSQGYHGGCPASKRMSKQQGQTHVQTSSAVPCFGPAAWSAVAGSGCVRSEERRVGKELRSRSSTHRVTHVVY